MSTVDPDDSAQQAIILRAISESYADDDGYVVREALARLRDHLADQPRVLKAPEEDRTRLFRGTGRVFAPIGKYWRRSDGTDFTWDELGRWYGPLTDAGPVEEAT